MWFGVLGVLVIRHEGTVIGISAAKQRAVLAALLVRANRVVSFGELADTVWDGAPSTGARTTTRNYIKVLRQALGPAAGARIITRDPGYLIQLDDGELDLLRFTRLCQEGGAAVRAGAWRRASDVLREGLQLWRGAPFADIPCPLLHRDEVPGLEQLRLQAIEWRVEADLHLGHHGRLVPELQAIASAYPLRENFHAQLMLALARCGRRAEALAAYQQARRILVGELGVEPAAELQRLQQQVLAGEVEPASGPDALPPAPRGDQDIAGPRSEPVVLHQLPNGRRCCVGRAGELDLLSSWRQDAGAPGETVLVTALSGTAGAGTLTDGSALLDTVNRRLLRELTADPRITMSALARLVGLSAPAVTERVQRLERAGVITGYRLEVSPAALGLPVTAFARIRPAAGQLAKVANLAAGLPEVSECHRITGEDCFLLKIHAPAIEDLETTLDRFLKYGQTSTSIVVSTPVRPRPIPIND
jgi:DNA-binding Lrp family transcriptional regulator/DNA-binding SARP family transcriptional activator